MNTKKIEDLKQAADKLNEIGNFLYNFNGDKRSLREDLHNLNRYGLCNPDGSEDCALSGPIFIIAALLRDFAKQLTPKEDVE